MTTITLTRNPTGDKGVKGRIRIPFDEFPMKDGEQAYEAVTLENAEYLIPEGRYELDMTWSPKFKKMMPEVLAVPERAGIRIHTGSRPEHSTGCILVDGMTLECVKAFINRIQKYTEDGKVYLEIKAL